MPPYSTILELDEKIRDFPIPEFPDNVPLDPSKPAMIMVRYVVGHTREASKVARYNSDNLCLTYTLSSDVPSSKLLRSSYD